MKGRISRVIEMEFIEASISVDSSNRSEFIVRFLADWQAINHVSFTVPACARIPTDIKLNSNG